MIVRKYETDKPCPYCGKTDGIYESCENGYKHHDENVIGFVASYTYHCVYCKRYWHSWSEAERFRKMVDTHDFKRIRAEKS